MAVDVYKIDLITSTKHQLSEALPLGSIFGLSLYDFHRADGLVLRVLRFLGYLFQGLFLDHLVESFELFIGEVVLLLKIIHVLVDVGHQKLFT